MGRLKIGVMCESFRAGVKRGIEKAAKLGADGVQVFEVGKEDDADSLRHRLTISLPSLRPRQPAIARRTKLTAPMGSLRTTGVSCSLHFVS